VDPITIVTALSTFAPMLTKWLGAGSKVQDVADKAADIAQIITGTSSPTAAIDALKADPALALQYQQAVMNQELEFEKLYIADLDSARKRDTAIKVAGKDNKRADWLAALCIAVVVSILGIVIFRSDIDEFAKGVITTILGMFLQQLNAIYSFEFGTTRSSTVKNNTIDDLTTIVRKQDDKAGN
jgi:hypothetical protein